MDNEQKKFDLNNTSTQRTVRLKPMVKQPSVGANNTDSQSVKKVSTNSGTFPKVGTQTGRISSITTNTSRVVKINSAIRSTINNNASGPNTTMMDFRTSEIQMASPAQSAPTTTRPAQAQSILNSLNLKPKVAEAAVVDAAPAAADNTQTAAIPKSPAPAKPSFSIPAAPAAAPAPAPAADDNTQTAAVPKTPAPAKPSFAIPTPAPAAAPAANPEAADNTQTAAVTKPAAVKPAFNINTSNASESDDSTVKLKRPARPAATQTNSVVPTITAKPAPAVQVTPAAAPSPVKPSAAPTVKLNLNREASSSAETVAAIPVQTPAAPAAETPKAKLGLKKAAEPQPPAPETVKEPVKTEAPAPEKVEAAADVKNDKDNKKVKKVPAALAKKMQNADTPASPDMPPGFHFAIGFLTVIFILAATTFCAIQYINTYQPRLFGKYIQIPFMEQVGK